MNNLVKRPVLRYHGGKWMLADWIISHFPEHKIYVEPFGGAASVLLKKKRSYSEIYNDLDSEIVNVFQILRDPDLHLKLEELLINTPYSREEFFQSYEESENPLEQARRTIVRSFMGFGSASASKKKTGFRSNSNRSGTTPAHDWVNYPNKLESFHQRLTGVVIENKDAFKIMEQHDSDLTLHYVDPPYHPETRVSNGSYKHELSKNEHLNMCEFLRSLSGMVILSGYDSELYTQELSDWQVVKKSTFADGAKPRTETLWINRAAHKNNLLTLL